MTLLLMNKVPVGTITAPFGSIDSIHKFPHTGVDLYYPIGTPLYAPLDGTVSKIVDYGDESLGKAVFVRMEDGRQYILGHLNSVNVHVDDKVTHGKTLLAFSGNTGHSTGGHLHFGGLDKNGHFIDPYTLFNSIHSHVQIVTDKATEVFSTGVVTDTFNWIVENVTEIIV
jgi:murein DD-endopeptidase MepM/ murein hydrolase activator NlpD